MRDFGAERVDARRRRNVVAATLRNPEVGSDADVDIDASSVAAPA